MESTEGEEGIRHLLKLFVTKLRVWALQIMAKSFGNELSFDYLTKVLLFESEEACIEALESFSKYT